MRKYPTLAQIFNRAYILQCGRIYKDAEIINVYELSIYFEDTFNVAASIKMRKSIFCVMSAMR